MMRKILLIILLIAPFMDMNYAYALPDTKSDSKFSNVSWAQPGAPFYVKTKSDIGLCSVGFPAEDAYNNHYFITAGHCGGAGDLVLATVAKNQENQGDIFYNITHSVYKLGNLNLVKVGVFVGRIISDQKYTLDASLVKLDPYAEITGGWAGIPIDINKIQVGMPVCKVGARTGKTCGVVKSINNEISLKNDDGGYLNYAKEASTTMCLMAGDSGGPVVSGDNYAVGIDSGGRISDDCLLPSYNGRSDSYITQLSDVMVVLKKQIPSLHLV